MRIWEGKARVDVDYRATCSERPDRVLVCFAGCNVAVAALCSDARGCLPRGLLGGGSLDWDGPFYRGI